MNMGNVGPNWIYFIGFAVAMLAFIGVPFLFKKWLKDE
jgi:hypothetical protein